MRGEFTARLGDVVAPLRRMWEDIVQLTPQFISVLALCLVCGLTFAGMATWLMSRRGNTIKDILGSSQFKDAKALSLEVTDKLKVSTNIPIVALYLVAALVAVGLPAYLSYVQSQATGDAPVLKGQIENYQQLVALDKGEKIYASPVEMSVTGDGRFNIPLRTTEGAQNILFESPTANSLTLALEVRPSQGKIKVSAGSFADQTIPIEGKFASLPKPLLMSRVNPAKDTWPAAGTQPSAAAAISPEFAAITSLPSN